MKLNGAPDTAGEVRYQTGAVATAVDGPHGLHWSVQQDGRIAVVKHLAHADHWSWDSKPFAPKKTPGSRLGASGELLKVAFPTTQFYPDCSNNNWGSEQDLINFLEQLASEGFAGMCHKVSEGNYYQDPYWGPCLQWCTENDFPVIGYHYVTGDNAAQQAQAFVGNGGGANGMTDWEVNGGNVANLGAVVNALNAAGVQLQLGYSPQWYWNEVGGGSLAGLANALVSSAYPGGAGYASTIYDNAGGDDGEGWESYGDATPTCWQFTDAADVGGIRVDCNAFKGTAAELAALFTGGTVSQPAEPAEPTDLEIDEDNQVQLRGPGLQGWPQLNGHTVVDALAAIGQKLGLEGFAPPEGN